jgi:hypothetical protein
MCTIVNSALTVSMPICVWCSCTYCAARPKEQKRHSKKCADITTQLGSLVEQYNILLPYGSKQRRQAQLEDVKRHTFAWANEYRSLDGEEPAGVWCMCVGKC